MTNLKRTSDNYLYTTWLAMIRRCTVRHHKAWESYGGRGIVVCDRWLSSFENFIYDMGERPSSLHSLDRKDNNLDYDPSNCRWATKREQANNRRPPKSRASAIRVDGLTLREMSIKYGINHATLKLRYKNGKRGAELLATDLRDGSYWRGKKRNSDRTMVR